MDTRVDFRVQNTYIAKRKSNAETHSDSNTHSNIEGMTIPVLCRATTFRPTQSGDAEEPQSRFHLTGAYNTMQTRLLQP
jgi:hypothetical protein